MGMGRGKPRDRAIVGPMKHFGILVIGLVAAIGCKSSTPASSTTPAGGGGDGEGAAAGGAGAAAIGLCEKFKADLSAQGEVTILDRTAKPAYADAGIWCRATVKTSGGLTCHLAALDSAAHATAMAADVGGGAWPVQQTDGTVVYKKEGGTAFLWCGDAVVTEEVQTPARAIVDAS